ASGTRLAGIQLWVGLPAREEETAPRFEHTPAAQLPMLEERDVHIRLILGEWRGARSPVATLSPMLYADAALGAGATLELEASHADRAAYIIDGEVEHEAETHGAGRMLVFSSGGPARIDARSAARVLILGGEPLDGERFLWWNFVSSSKERIVQAAADWKARRFAPIPGETEFIPLPDNAP
ncbi:MAG TPA: pirin-like C-terminal cupin domain-containing protein, partial [Burkholderiales bacterium]|nr:pirin-like C-terminal cupin domain-containing protein [Burkholderiales bacterium]